MGKTGDTPSQPEDNILGITDIEELNREEATGIARAEKTILELEENVELTIGLVLELHKIAFGHLYEWAGKWRKTDIQVGSHIPPSPYQIANLMYQYIDELNHQIKSIKDKEDLIKALSYCQHRFVFIHPFTNGNGRTARLITNIVALKNGYNEINIYHRTGEKRQDYIKAVRAADTGNYLLLEELIKSELKPIEP